MTHCGEEEDAGTPQLQQHVACLCRYAWNVRQVTERSISFYIIAKKIA